MVSDRCKFYVGILLSRCFDRFLTSTSSKAYCNDPSS